MRNVNDVKGSDVVVDIPSFILTMRNVNFFFVIKIIILQMCFILTMRNVNKFVYTFTIMGTTVLY